MLRVVRRRCRPAPRRTSSRDLMSPAGRAERGRSPADRWCRWSARRPPASVARGRGGAGPTPAVKKLSALRNSADSLPKLGAARRTRRARPAPLPGRPAPRRTRAAAAVAVSTRPARSESMAAASMVAQSRRLAPSGAGASPRAISISLNEKRPSVRDETSGSRARRQHAGSGKLARMLTRIVGSLSSSGSSRGWTPSQ